MVSGLYDGHAKSDLRADESAYATLCRSSRQSCDAVHLSTLAFNAAREHGVCATGAVLPGAAHRRGEAIRLEAGVAAECVDVGGSAADDRVRVSTGRLDQRVGGLRVSARRQIIVPVAGADMTRVEDSFNDPRDGDRVHRAIDILAARGTPILSADDGRILRMTTSALGGISMYTIDSEQRIVYYYAHMDHYNDAMSPGKSIAKGDTLGFVGTTGNAPKDTPHLHFQVMRWPADGRYWNGEPIDPFELLVGHTQSAGVTPRP